MMTDYPEVEAVQSKIYGGLYLKEMENEVRLRQRNELRFPLPSFGISYRPRVDLGKKSLRVWGYKTSLPREMRSVCNRRSSATCLPLLSTTMKSGTRSIAQTLQVLLLLMSMIDTQSEGQSLL